MWRFLAFDSIDAHLRYEEYIMHAPHSISCIVRIAAVAMALIKAAMMTETVTVDGGTLVVSMGGTSPERFILGGSG